MVPSLLMLGEEDATIGPNGIAAIRANFAAHRGPAYLFELKHGGHYSFTDMFKLNPTFGDGVGTGKRKDTGETITFTNMETTYQMINSYTVAFLGYYVKSEREFLPFLTKNHWPDEIEWKYSGVEAGH
jgi:hypothetical protein